jgi:hypothetical protein
MRLKSQWLQERYYKKVTFHLREHKDFFDCVIDQWLENAEIPIVLWSYINLKVK